jgi:predicted Zn-dependent protease
MGHEIAHALREHGRERASQVMAQGIALSILGAVTGVSRGGMDLTQLALNVTLNLPNSRAHETEADRIGVELAARAGYDPRAAVSVWEKMDRQSEGGPREILSTHRAPSTRITDLKGCAARVQPVSEQARPRGQ